jgi:hypothetical protein
MSESGTKLPFAAVQNYVRFSNRPFRVKRFQTIHDCGVNVARGLALLFSNRPFRVKRFQTIHDCGVNVARGLALLSGLGTKALVWRFLCQGICQGRASFSFVGGGVANRLSQRGPTRLHGF